jgi:hypothetical protein
MVLVRTSMTPEVDLAALSWAADVAAPDACLGLRVWESEGGHLDTFPAVNAAVVGGDADTCGVAPSAVPTQERPDEAGCALACRAARSEEKVAVMKIQMNSDKNVVLDSSLARRVEQELTSALDRFSDQITRIEVHLGDEIAGRSDGRDKRCMLEARPAGQSPIAVTDWAGTVEEAVSGAVEKLVSLLESKTGRADASKGGRSIRHLDVREGLS